MTQRQLASPFPTTRPLKLPASVLRPRAPLARPVRSVSASLIGRQVHELRLAAGASGGKLAQRAGISRSMLSRIERGLVSPSIETLGRIASGLDVSLSRLFAEPPSCSDLCHVPAGRGLRVERLGALADHRHELLGHLGSANLCVEPYLVSVEPEAGACVPLQQPGLKFLYLLAGTATYRYGAKVIELEEGDSLLFDAAIVHGVEAVGAQPLAYLSLAVRLRD